MSWEDDILEAVRDRISAISVKLPDGDIARVVGWSLEITLDDGPFTREWVEENVPPELIGAGQVYHVIRRNSDRREFFLKEDCETYSVDLERAVELTISELYRRNMIDERDDDDEYDEDGYYRYR